MTTKTMLQVVETGYRVLYYGYSSAEPIVETVVRTTKTKIVLSREREYNRDGYEYGKQSRQYGSWIAPYDEEVLAFFQARRHRAIRQNAITSINWKLVSDEKLAEAYAALHTLGIVE